MKLNWNDRGEAEYRGYFIHNYGDDDITVEYTSYTKDGEIVFEGELECESLDEALELIDRICNGYRPWSMDEE